MKESDNRQFQPVIRIRHNAAIYRPISRTDCPNWLRTNYLGGFDGGSVGGLLVGSLLGGRVGLVDD